MSEVAAAFPPMAGQWTLDDLLRLPETGHRYEIIEGSLLVTPPAGVRHGVVVAELASLLKAAAPPHLYPLPAGVGVQLGRSVLIPDLLVLSTAAARAGGPIADPADVTLVVEVLSPSHRTTDLVTKRAAYADGGIAHCWIVDPDAPSLTMLRLRAGSYQQVAVVDGDESYVAEEPFAVTVVPAALCDPGA